MDGLNPDKLRLYGIQTVEYVARYWEDLENVTPMSTIPVRSIVKALPETAPEKPEDWHDIMKDVDKIIMPGITHWHSPRFHAYFPTGNTYPCICADILSAGIGCVGFAWITSPACTELEIAMMNWLGKLLNLPEEFLDTGKGNAGFGIIQGTASESLYLSMLAARDRAVKRALKAKEEGGNVTEALPNENAEKIAEMQNKIVSYCSEDADMTATVNCFAEAAIKILNDNKVKDDKCIHDRLVVYTSEEAHSSIEKSCLLCSIKCRKLPTDEQLSLRGPTLEEAIKKDKEEGYVPAMIVCTLGSTSSVAFDNIKELGQIAQKEGIWMHVDAAYAGASFICPQYRPMLDGVEYAESFNFNPHKWLQINFDCSALWIKNSSTLDSFEVNPEYLLDKSQEQIADFRNFQIALGRRFRSLKLWFTLRMFGAEAMREQILRQVALAKDFENMLVKDDRFELVCTNILAVICFRLKGSNEMNAQLYEKINSGGKIFITKAMIRESSDAPVLILRFAICSTLTELKHVEEGWKEIVHHADTM